MWTILLCTFTIRYSISNWLECFRGLSLYSLVFVPSKVSSEMDDLISFVVQNFRQQIEMGRTNNFKPVKGNRRYGITLILHTLDLDVLQLFGIVSLDTLVAEEF